MKPCICGCPMHGGTCRCGCSYYEPDDGTDGDKSDPWPDLKADRYQGIYSPPGGYVL
jgi:hypothetical protein